MNNDEAQVVNLASNAMRFAHWRVQIAWGLKEKSFWLRVDDDGPGIPTHKRNYVFEPFTRLDPSRSNISGGTGLGLANVWRIARKHGGEVTAHENSRGGARFRGPPMLAPKSAEARRTVPRPCKELCVLCGSAGGDGQFESDKILLTFPWWSQPWCAHAHLPPHAVRTFVAFSCLRIYP